MKFLGLEAKSYHPHIKCASSTTISLQFIRKLVAEFATRRQKVPLRELTTSGAHMTI